MASGLFFFDLYRSYLTIERNASLNLPKSSSEIYSQVLGKMFKGSSWQDPILDGGDRRQLITFTVYKDSQSNDVKFNNSESNDSKSNDSKLIVKRKAILCKIQQSKSSEEDNLIFKTPEIQEFLNEGLKEYFISRLLSAHPAGINCYDFKITKLPKINLLVYEFMMEYGGISLEDYFNSYKPKDFNGIHFFIKMINILKFIEKLGIAYNDVKMGNFLVDSQGHLRITDYDASQKADLLNSQKVTKISKLLGYTDGYVAPEAKKFAERQKLGMLKPNEKINPWKADVYSCGMVGLVLFGVLLNPENIGLLDRFKEDEEIHNEIIADMSNQIECEDNTLKEKIQFIISLCIDYNPTKRPNFAQLSILLERIEDSKLDLKGLKEIWNKILNEEDKKQKENIRMEEKLQIKDKEIEKMKTNEKELSDENLKLKNQLKELNEINSNLREEIKNSIDLIKSKTEIPYNSQNLYSYVNDVITYFQAKMKKDNELVENKKSIPLEECKKPLIELKKELPKDLNKIPRIKSNQLNPTIIIPIPPNKPKYKNYEDAFNQIVNGNILRPEIANYIKKAKENEWWLFEKKYNEATKEEILNILELVKYSKGIKKLTFTENSNFKEECERAYLHAIKENNSLVTIILYQTNVSKEVTLEMLKILEIKPKIKVLVVEKAKIEDKVAQEFQKKMNLDISNFHKRFHAKIKKEKDSKIN